MKLIKVYGNMHEIDGVYDLPKMEVRTYAVMKVGGLHKYDREEQPY